MSKAALRYGARIVDEATARVHARTTLDLRALIEHSIGRAVASDYKPGIEDADSAMIEHVLDWLVASVMSEQSWLRNVDERGVPRKFSKFKGLASVHAEAERCLTQMRMVQGPAKLKEGDEELVAELEDGYTLVRLLTPQALDAESSRMQHCVGTGSYDGAVERDEIRILSLRDRAGKPHATLEIDMGTSGTIEQLKGKQNVFPADRYFRIILPWIRQQGHKVNERELTAGWIEHDGDIVNIRDLPPGTRLNRGLLLIYAADNEPLVMPEGLVIEGGLSLHCNSGGFHMVISPGVRVEESMTVTGTRISGMENVEVKGEIALSRCPIDAMPCQKVYNGPVHVDTLFPEHMIERGVFNGGLWISNVPHARLPSAAVVNGDLKINEIGRLEIGDRVAIKGSFIVKSLRHFTDPLVVIGADVRVGGDFTVEAKDISIGDRFSVAGGFSARHAMFTDIPRAMSCGGLHFHAVAGLDQIPEDAEVAGDIMLVDVRNDMSYASIGIGGRKVVHGNLHIQNMGETVLPDGLTVGGTLNISNSAVRSLPAGLTVGLDFIARKSPFKSLPDDMLIGRGLDLSGSGVTSLPDDMCVNGSLDIRRTALERFPLNVRVAEILHLGKVVPSGDLTRHFHACEYDLCGAGTLDLSNLEEIEGRLWVRSDQLGELPEGLNIGGSLIVQGDAFSRPFPPGIRVAGNLRIVEEGRAFLNGMEVGKSIFDGSLVFNRAFEGKAADFR